MAALGPSGSRSAGGTSKQVENLLKKHLNSDSVPNSNTKWNTPPPLPTQETQLADLGFFFLVGGGVQRNRVSWGPEYIWFWGLWKKSTQFLTQNAHDHPNTSLYGGNSDRGKVWVKRDTSLEWPQLKNVTFANFTKVCDHVNTLPGPWKGPYKWGALKTSLQGNPSLNR